MLYSLLADLTLLFHLTFVLFVLAGSLLAVKWRRIVWLHLPAAAWAAVVEFSGWLCPLTPLENWLREQAGTRTYQTDFIGHYLLPILYPDGLTRDVQMVLGSIVLLLNGTIYAVLWRKCRIAHSEAHRTKSPLC